MEFCQLLSLRQSTRKFQPTPLSRKEIEAIIKAANHAPIGSNRYEDVRLTVVVDQEKLLYLCEAAWKRFSSQTKIREIAGDTASDSHQKKFNLFYDAPAVIFVSHRKQSAQPGIEWANVAVVATIMHLEATNLGLGSVFMWGALESMRLYPELDHTAILNLPEDFYPLLALAIGYPVKPLEYNEKTDSPFCVNFIPSNESGN